MNWYETVGVLLRKTQIALTNWKQFVCTFLLYCSLFSLIYPCPFTAVFTRSPSLLEYTSMMDKAKVGWHYGRAQSSNMKFFSAVLFFFHSIDSILPCLVLPSAPPPPSSSATTLATTSKTLEPFVTTATSTTTTPISTTTATTSSPAPGTYTTFPFLEILRKFFLQWALSKEIVYLIWTDPCLRDYWIHWTKKCKHCLFHIECRTRSNPQVFEILSIRSTQVQPAQSLTDTHTWLFLQSYDCKC